MVGKDVRAWHGVINNWPSAGGPNERVISELVYIYGQAWEFVVGTCTVRITCFGLGIPRHIL